MESMETRKRFPWLKVALVISVTLNLAALGVLGGIITRAGNDGSVMRAAVSALPGDERRKLRRETRDIWRAARTEGQGGPTAPAMIAALRAEEFDADAFAASLQQAQDRLVRMSSEMHQRLVTRVSAMTPDQRHAYADALEDQMKARRWRPRTEATRGN
jgi:uncharacterized membrane protein